MENIIQIIRQKGCKLTKPRQAVLDVLEKSDQPMSARLIHEKLKGADLVSVYRSLKLFKALGIVQAEKIGNEEKYCLAGEPHHHIICEKCGYMESIKCDHEYVNKNFTDIKHQLTLSGVCHKCR